MQLHQKGMSKESWPALQLTCDEALLAHMVNNTVNIYKTKAFAEGDNALMWRTHTWLGFLTSQYLTGFHEALPAKPADRIRSHDL